MQAELALMGVVDTTQKDLPFEVVAAQATEQAALRMVVANHPAKLGNREIAEMMGMTVDMLSKILNADYQIRKCNPRGARYRGGMFGQDLEEVCSNNGYSQWLDLRKKKLLNHQRDVESQKAALRARLAELGD